MVLNGRNISEKVRNISEEVIQFLWEGRAVDEQSNQAKEFLKHLEVCAAHPEEADCMDKPHRKMIDKEREYRKEILDKRRTHLV